MVFALALATAGQVRAAPQLAENGPALFLPMIQNYEGMPIVAGCTIFPPDNIWNTRVDGPNVKVHSLSSQYIASIGLNTHLHPDFGTVWNGQPIGIPYTSVPAGQPGVKVSFTYASESNPGPYPIPANAPVEGGSDRHVLVVDSGSCKLYEMWNAVRQADGSWKAGSGAIFDLRTNLLRPDGWTSADAAGLPILPGLVRYDEVSKGGIHHALRFTASQTQQAYLWPARHFASSNTSASLPPMGLRLKTTVNLSSYPAEMQVILRAFQQYGLILADNGSNWYISGSPDSRWDDDMLVTQFNRLSGSDFEAVDVSGLIVNNNSGQAQP